MRSGRVMVIAASTLISAAIVFAGSGATLAATKVATNWRTTQVMPPMNADADPVAKPRDSALLGISCRSGNACTTVGWYVDTSDNLQAMASSRPGG